MRPEEINNSDMESKNRILQKTSKKVEDDLRNIVKTEEKDIKEKFKKLRSKASSEFHDSKKALVDFSEKSSKFSTETFGKSKKYLEKNVPIAGKKFRKNLGKTWDSVEDNAPKTGNKIRNSFLSFVEECWRTKAKGKEHGLQSIEILLELAKLRKEGLITKQEYDLKKKEILKRI